MSDDQSPEPQDSKFKSKGPTPDSLRDEAAAAERGLHRDRSTAEISGETIDAVGEATGEFPSAADNGGKESTGRGAFMVGAGILISRIIGVIRQRVFAYYFGNSLAADAFTAAFRIPNFLQNVF